MSAIGSTNIGKRVSNMEVSPEFDGYSKVVIQVTDDLYYEAGVSTGRALELKCPWGTQKMAEDILSKVRGHQYQPFRADSALVDLSAELGDGITVNGVYSGLYKQEIKFDALGASKIEAPQDEELDHEYPFQEVTDREVIRQYASTKAQFALHANEIAARVTREGGDNKSFGWSLTEEGFILSSNSKTVFKATEDGIEVTGKVTALSGYIGNGTQGFEITSTSIRNGVRSYGDTSHYGVYIGTDGIVLGKGAFKVDSHGNLYAQSGTFTGNVYANRIQVGGDAGYVQGYQVGSGTITSANTNGYLNGGVANGYFAGDVFSGAATAGQVAAGSLFTGNHRLYLGSQSLHLGTASFTDGSGNPINLRFATW